ncbi:Sialic acid-specific 9-O-acetylesterase [Lentimonas sp. CC19]|nr:Sialic acid-specific 9-O-acetylesterase [Lentimonas sp. CC10]CAA6696430.1 Sialic acid-specific 9-O-acetylesterase [Lentimonas sp. CC19]CAA7070515.1 Sialic acid-specific 9-O-acetylesterase [Lentimonas sp. CC11]
MYNMSIFSFLCFLLVVCAVARAEVSLPHIFGDHMVLQRDQVNLVWGKADALESIIVTIAEQSHTTVADLDGRWSVELEPLLAGGPYELKVAGEHTAKNYKDVLVGEVWICSGQSNMKWPLSRSNHGELYALSANQPELRLITVPTVGRATAQDDFGGAWAVSSPGVASDFSAIGYYYGLRLQQTLGVPVGLIDCSWGGSTAETWIPRDRLEASGDYADLIERAEAKVSAYSDAIHEERLAQHRAWVAAGRPDPKVPWVNDPRTGNHRPANAYNGMLHPIQGYGMRGVIWYQGESNSGRGYQYRDLFPLVIQTWRDLWGQGDFPFYWVQLADFKEEVTMPSESYWAELREAQTMALALPNTGQVVIIDQGEGKDIHPRNKLTVANRLARIALARDYEYEVAYQNPRYASMLPDAEGLMVSFKNTSVEGLRAYDTQEVAGFTIAGADRVFVPAHATVIGTHQVKVWSDRVTDPVAVRYAWADNPVANLQDRNGLPVTPFRTDDWPGVSVESR